jgi:hypothetical protein
MDSKTRTLILSIAIAAILWLLGGFVFNHALGMVCVFVGITIVGLATGSIMDTPEPVHDDKK